MSLVNDVLRDLDERSRVAGDGVDIRLGSDHRCAHVPPPPTSRSRSAGSRYVMLWAVLAGITLSGSTLSRPDPAPAERRSERDAVHGMAASPPAASANGDGGALAARPSRPARSGTALLPRYVRPRRSDDASPRAHPDGNAPVRPGVPAEPPATPPPSTAPRSRTAEDVVTSAPRRAAANAPESGRSSYIEVTPRALSDDERLLSDFHAAADAYKAGALAEAERRLTDLIERDDGQHRARLLLARLYTDRGLDERAEALLSQGLRRYPRHAPYAGLHARILARRGRDDAAIALLEDALPAAHGHAELHALLAGLHRRGGDPFAAADGYRAALRIDPTPGEWWVGLGIASEQTGDGDTAEDAYREASRRPLGGEVDRYVKRRLSELLADGRRDENHRHETDPGS